jgi:hypothetical protein
MTEPTSVVSTMTLVMQSVDVSSTAHVMNAMDVLGQVHAFYDSAWTKLIWFFSLAGIFIGIIMPLLISYIQSGTIRKAENRIELKSKELKEGLENKMKEIEFKILGLEVETEKINSEVEKINSEIDKIDKGLDIHRDRY